MTSFLLTAERTADGTLPFLRLTPADSPVDAPLVLVLHGLGRSKEHMLPSLYAFAQAGFQAVAIDARLHGERDGAEAREARLLSAQAQTLQEMIVGTAQDVLLLLDALGVGRAAIHGVSLGGYITFAALADEPRLAVASVAMGSPDWLEGLRGLGLGPGHPVYDYTALHSPLTRAAATYPPRPLLMLHGEQDEVVPVQGVCRLYETLLPLYAHATDHLRLTLFPNLGHRYTDEMLTESVAWTRRFF